MKPAPDAALLTGASINYLASLPFDVGLPVLAAGLGLALAGGVRAMVRAAVHA